MPSSLLGAFHLWQNQDKAFGKCETLPHCLSDCICQEVTFPIWTFLSKAFLERMKKLNLGKSVKCLPLRRIREGQENKIILLDYHRRS